MFTQAQGQMVPRVLFKDTPVKEPRKIVGVYATRVEKQKEYDGVCEQIYGYLIGYLGTEPIKRIRNHNIKCGDGVGAYNILDKEYQVGSKNNRRKLIQQLTNLKMVGQLSTLSAYTYEFKRICGILFTHETQMPEEVLITLYMSGLGPEYTPAKNLLSITPWANLEDIYEQLRNFEETNNIRRNTRHSRPRPRGYNVTFSRNNRNRTRQPRKRQPDLKGKVLKCFNCFIDHLGGRGCGFCAFLHQLDVWLTVRWDVDGQFGVVSWQVFIIIP